MGRGNEFAVTQIIHGTDHHNRCFQIRCAIINSRNQMIVHIRYQSGQISVFVFLSF